MPINKEKLTKLQPLIEMVNESVSKEELLASVKLLAAKLDTRMKGDKSELDMGLAMVATKVRETLDRVEARAAEIRDGIDGLNGEKGDKGDKGDPGKDGKDADILTAKADLVAFFQKNLAMFGTQFRDGLELLEKGERLKIEAIENLPEELEKLRKRINTESKIALGGGGSMRVQQTILTPAEAVDNVTTTFTFGQKPLIVVVNGANYREGHGWAWVNQQVVLDNVVGASGDLYAIV